MFNTIKKKIMFAFLVISLGLIVLFSSVSIYEVSEATKRQMEIDGLGYATTVKAAMEDIGFDKVEELQDFVENLQGNSEGYLKYIGIQNIKNKVVVSTDREVIGIKLSDAYLVEDVKKGKSIGQIHVYKGEEVYDASVPMRMDGNIVGIISIGISVDNMRKSISDNLIKIVVIAGLSLVIVVILATLIANKIAKPIERITEVVIKAGEGDLSVWETLEVNSKDEIGILATKSKESSKVLSNLIDDVKKTVGHMVSISSTLKEVSGQVTDSSEQIAIATADVSEKSSDQAEDLNGTMYDLREFFQRIESIDTTLGELLKRGERVKNTAHEGRVIINELQKSEEQVESAFAQVDGKVEALNASILEIQTVMDVISGIAKQTNLLALNASIESARAGEYGRGFSVVAEEIRKLAEEVLKSSMGINDSINKIVEEGHYVQKTTGDVREKIRENKDQSQKSIASFKDIIAHMEVFPQEISGINNMLREVDDVKIALGETVMKIANSSEEVSELIEEITASTEEQTAITHNLLQSSIDVQKWSQTLEKNTSLFS